MADPNCGTADRLEKEMSGRDIPYHSDITCDSCGAVGVFDFMGDYYCENCSELFLAEEEERRCYYADPASLKELWGYVTDWWSGIFR